MEDYYMNNENVIEWLQLADEDLYSAKILNEAARKPYEIICYHCAQAAEKYLKAYLTYQNIIPKEPLINLTLISGSLLFFSFSCGKLRKTIIK